MQATNNSSSSAFDAFQSEVAQSPLLRQYGTSAVKRARNPPPPANDADGGIFEEFDAGLAYGAGLRARFLSPRIDDPGLPFADAFVCIGGALFIAQWALSPGIPPDVKIPPPSWLAPVAMPAGVDWRGIPYILPTLVHGSELAACFVLGALAANAYESAAFDGTLREAITRTWRAGAFATGVLLLSTQATTYLSLTSQGLDPYTVPSTAGIDAGARADAQILSTAFEVLCDVAVQGVQLTLFRAYRWRSRHQGPPGGGPGRRRGLQGGRGSVRARGRGKTKRPDYDADEYNPLRL